MTYHDHHERTLAKHVEKINRQAECLRDIINKWDAPANASGTPNLQLYRHMTPAIDRARAELERDVEI